MKVIIGLGNPEPRYDGTRHNLGFWVIDKLAGDKTWKNNAKFMAETCEVSIDGEKVLLVKPTTFYNNVGQSGRLILDFYKLDPSDFLAIHDDLSLPLGTLRVRQKGSDAGNNGIKSLNSHVGQSYGRLRIGVDGPQRVLAGDTNYVLGKFSQAEQAVLDKLSSHIEQACQNFISGQNDPTSLTIETE